MIFQLPMNQFNVRQINFHPSSQVAKQRKGPVILMGYGPVKNSSHQSRKFVDPTDRSRRQSGLDFLQRQRPHNLWFVLSWRWYDRPDSSWWTHGKIIPREIISYDRRDLAVISLFGALCSACLPFPRPIPSLDFIPSATDTRGNGASTGTSEILINISLIRSGWYSIFRVNRFSVHSSLEENVSCGLTFFFITVWKRNDTVS